MQVPTLVLIPEDDRLVGAHAAEELVVGIADAGKIVLPGSGHMFRFTHPDVYGAAITEAVELRRCRWLGRAR